MLVAGDSFHGLKLRELCGRGGFGEVWLCEDISGKRMALKVITKDESRSDWKREFKGMKKYRKITENAPALLQIFSVGEDEKCFYYTMEAADSVSEVPYKPDTLATRLKNGPLPESELWGVFTQIFKAVKLIHKKGVAHRDIKPDNIVFVNGTAKLADIGLISPLDVTVTQAAFTQVYLPPEAVHEPELLKDKKMLPKFDIYAFGKVIYCSVTGNPPEYFPSVPANINIVNNDPVKLFFNLSRLICENDPAERADSTENVAKELAVVGKVLRTKDFWIYETGHAALKLKYLLKSIFCNTGIWLSKYGIFILLLFVIITSLFLGKLNEKAKANTVLQAELQEMKRNQEAERKHVPQSWYQQTKGQALEIYRKAKGFFSK